MRFLGFVLITGLTVHVGCGGSTPAVRPAAKRAAAPDFWTVTIEPAVTVTHYGDQALLTEDDPRIEQLNRRVFALVQQVAKEMGKGVPAVDVRLSSVAQTVLPAVRKLELPPADIIQFALSSVGMIQPVERFAMMRMPFAYFLQSNMEALQAQFRSILRSVDPQMVGIGIENTLGVTATLIVLFAQKDLIKLETLARQMSVGQRFEIRGTLHPSFTHPSLWVTLPGGNVVALRIDPLAPRGFAAGVVCETLGRHQFEILADGSFGPTVLANFPIWCGEETPRERSFKIARERRFAKDEEQQGLLMLINEARSAMGLPTVELHGPTSKVALSHSTDMRDNDFFGHLSPRTHGPAERLRAAGVAYEIYAENVALGTSVEWIHNGLMNSPGHRHAILLPGATHVGIGLTHKTLDGGMEQLYATELFTRHPRVDRHSDSPAAEQISPPAAEHPSNLRFVEDSAKIANCQVLGLAMEKIVVPKSGASALEQGKNNLRARAGKLGANTILLEHKRLGQTLHVSGEFFVCPW